MKTSRILSHQNIARRAIAGFISRRTAIGYWAQLLK